MSNPIKLRCLDDSSENMLIVSTNTRASTNASTGALVIHKGGLSINSTENAANSSAGGALTVGGGAAFAQDVKIGGDITVGNINLTGALFQNGESYASSQWTTTNGNLTYTSGNIEILDVTTGNINFTGTLFQNGEAYLGSQWTTTSGNVSYTSGSVVATDLETTNFTVGNFVGDNFSAGNLVVSALNLGVSSVFSGSFSASNNVSTPTDVTGFVFDNTITAFHSNLMVNVDATENLYENFTLSGNKTDNGWNLYVSSIGGTSGVAFIMTSGGQLQYTSTNLAGFVSSTFRYSCTQISESGTYTPVNPSTSGTYIFNTLQVSGTQPAVAGSDNGSLLVQGGMTVNRNIIANEISITNATIGQLVATNVSAGAFVGSNASLSGNSNTIGALITTGGNVGIGTSSPSAPLQFGSQALSSRIMLWGDDTVNSYHGFGIGAGALQITVPNSGGHYILFGNNTGGNFSETMRITNAGYIGIGTSSPSIKLDVVGEMGIRAAALWDHLYFSHSGSTALVRAGGAESGLAFEVGNGSEAYGGQTYTRVMTMLTSGNVGIGTSSPIYTLDVNGTFDVSNSNGSLVFASTGNVGIGTMSPNATLHVIGNTYTENKELSYSYDNTWTAQTYAVDNDWFSVCWAAELGIFCTVSLSGTNNRVMTSPDGINWTLQTSAADNSWRSVCWAAELGLFCAVANSGTNNRVMTSPDGITWTAQTSAADNEWNGVCWAAELKLFCAVAITGTNNRVMTSPDGITWTAQTSAANNQWRSVCWAAELGLFCAVAPTGTNNRVMTSPDGIIWTTQTSAANNDWNAVCWAAELGLFCAVATTGTNNRVMTSPNGITWTLRTSAADNQWRSVCWAAELRLFVAVAITGTNNRVMTSPDGITWTSRTPTADNQWFSVCWAAELGLFCAVASTGTNNRVMTSSSTITETGGELSITQKGTRLAIGHYSPQTALDVKGSIRSSNQILAASGTIERPGISFYGDTNTGLFRPTTDTLSITTNGTELVRFKPDGNVDVTGIINVNGASSSISLSRGDHQILLQSPGGHTGIVLNNDSTGDRSRFDFFNRSNETVGNRYVGLKYNGDATNLGLFIRRGGNVGIGTTGPSFQLQLSSDSAAKPSTNTWTVSSDERLKTNIQLADLDICYNNVKNIPLKRYTWREDVYSQEEVPDRSKLGWIAQDVESHLPKAVEQKEMFGYTDCRTLNSDQIIASLYGAVQKLIQQNEELKSFIQSKFPDEFN